MVLTDDVDGVIGEIARMGDPVATGQKLPFDIGAEGIAHAAMPATDPQAGADGRQDYLGGIRRQVAHRPYRHQQTLAGEEVGVAEGRQGIRQGNGAAGFAEQMGGKGGGLGRLMARPAAVDDEGVGRVMGLFHKYHHTP